MLDGWDFHQQQHPIGKVWSSESPLLGEMVRAWTLSEGQIEHPAFTHVRPYSIIYRLTEAGWICVEFGEQSFYVGWFGADYAKSSIGRPLGKLPGGEEFARMLDESFHDVQLTQSVRLDHIFTQVPRTAGGALYPVAYERLMLCGRFPDGSLSVISLVVPTTKIDITELDPERLQSVENLAPVHFDKGDLLLNYFDS